MRTALARFEAAARTLRHSRILAPASGLWNIVRPLYDRTLGQAGRNGLVRVMNGTDEIRVHSESRGVTDSYEPDVWPLVMKALRPGDTFVDIGAFVGLYAIAAKRHVGPEGHVVAYEPDEENRRLLGLNVSLNTAGAPIEIVAAALGEHVGTIELTGGASEVQARYTNGNGIRCSTLDADFPDKRVDVLKIDVEGFEQDVLRGGRRLLRDVNRRPRAVFVEVHPFAWERTGTTSETLLAELHESGYSVQRPDGSAVDRLDVWEEVIATPRP